MILGENAYTFYGFSYFFRCQTLKKRGREVRLREEKHTAKQTFQRPVMVKIILKTQGRSNNSPQINTAYSTDQSDMFQDSDRAWANTHCLMQSGIDTYSIGTSSARAAKL